jgi:hypothetical protein
VSIQSHDPAYWLAEADKALKRAERCRGDLAAHALLLELADDYAWLAKRVRPLSRRRIAVVASAFADR